jgi:hypothetical protein
MAKPGPKRGASQRQWLPPDPEDDAQRVSIYAQVPSRARAKGRRAAAAANMSFAAYLETLLLRDEVDESGRPTWATAATGLEPTSARVATTNGSEMAAREPLPAGRST